MIEELRASIIKKQKAKDKEQFFSAKSKLIFWWTVFLISGWALFYLHIRHLDGRYIRAIRSGLSLLGVFSFFVGVMAVIKVRGAKTVLQQSEPPDELSEPDGPESGQ